MHCQEVGIHLVILNLELSLIGGIQHFLVLILVDQYPWMRIVLLELEVGVLAEAVQFVV